MLIILFPGIRNRLSDLALLPVGSLSSIADPRLARIWNVEERIGCAGAHGDIQPPRRSSDRALAITAVSSVVAVRKTCYFEGDHHRFVV